MTTSQSPDASEASAKRLTEEIRTTALLGADKLEDLLIKAVRSRVWVALNHAKCRDYLFAEFGEIPLRLTPRGRTRVFKAMQDDGEMSLREIAKVTGYSKDTVHRALPPVANETKSDEKASRPFAFALRSARRARMTAAHANKIVEAGLGSQARSDLNAAIAELTASEEAIIKAEKRKLAETQRLQQAARDRQLAGGDKRVAVVALDSYRSSDEGDDRE